MAKDRKSKKDEEPKKKEDDRRKCSFMLSPKVDELLSVEAKRRRVSRSKLVDELLWPHLRVIVISIRPGPVGPDEVAA